MIGRLPRMRGRGRASADVVFHTVPIGARAPACSYRSAPSEAAQPAQSDRLQLVHRMAECGRGAGRRWCCRVCSGGVKPFRQPVVSDELTPLGFTSELALCLAVDCRR
jgi:hypothetical protein